MAAWKDLLPRTMPVTWEYIVKAHRHKQMESSHVIYSPNERNLTFFAEEHLEGIKIKLALAGTIDRVPRHFFLRFKGRIHSNNTEG